MADTRTHYFIAGGESLAIILKWQADMAAWRKHVDELVAPLGKFAGVGGLCVKLKPELISPVNALAPVLPKGWRRLSGSTHYAEPASTTAGRAIRTAARALEPLRGSDLVTALYGTAGDHFLEPQDGRVFYPGWEQLAVPNDPFILYVGTEAVSFVDLIVRPHDAKKPYYVITQQAREGQEVPTPLGAARLKASAYWLWREALDEEAVEKASAAAL